jgi:hypothetical protein
MPVTDEQLVNKARAIIAYNGEISSHDLVHKICTALNCFGELNGNKLNSLQITNNEYPMYKKTRDKYTYIAEEPVVEDSEDLI